MWDANKHRLKVHNPNRPIGDEELRKHNTVSDGWMVIHGKVFDVTPFINYHPGGVANMKKGLGIDATALFNRAHSYVKYENILVDRKVGMYVPSQHHDHHSDSDGGHGQGSSKDRPQRRSSR